MKKRYDVQNLQKLGYIFLALFLNASVFALNVNFTSGYFIRFWINLDVANIDAG